MKVIVISGSQRNNGNTTILITHVFDELRKDGIECELIQLAGGNIPGCKGCGGCAKEKNKQCVAYDDIVNYCMDKIIAADGIILGSPTYVANISPLMKAFIERIGVISMLNGGLLKYKVGAAVVASRRCGANNVFNAINEFFLSNQMIVPGSNYWNMALGGAIGEVENDQEGLATLKLLGQNMSWLMKKLA